MVYDIQSQQIDIKGNVINYRPFTSRDERIYLSNRTGKDDFGLLVSSLILPNIEYKPMMLAELQYLIIELKKKSSSEALELNVTCPKCNARFDFEKPLDELIHFIKPQIDKTKIKAQDIEVTLRKIPSKDLLLKICNAPQDDMIYYEFLGSIQSINYKGEEHKTFLFEDLEKFFDGTPSYIFKELFNKFLEIKGHLHLYTEVICPYPDCNHKFNSVFKDIESFL